MSYTPTTWAAGDTVTAAKLNKLEQGVASSGGGALVEIYYDNDLNCFVTDKTAEQIVQAASTGPVSMHYNDSGNAIDVYLPVIIRSNGGGSYELYVNSLLGFNTDALLLDVHNHAHWICPD